MRKVAIIGRIIHKDYVDTVPLEYEVWTHAKGTIKFSRRDRVFEVHNKEAYSKFPDHLIKGKTWGFEKELLQIDVDKIVAISPLGLSSSAAWMIAQAVVDEVDEILLAGTPMKAGPEYLTQRPGVAFWLGVAAGRGIKITPKVDLLDTRQYPKDYLK